MGHSTPLRVCSAHVPARAEGEVGRAAPGLSWDTETKVLSISIHWATWNNRPPLWTSVICSRSTSIRAG